MFFGLMMWDCFFLLRGKLKVKHLSLFITGRGGREKEWRGDHMVFRVTGGEKQSLLTRYKGGATEHCLPMEGIIQILQSFGGGGGGTRLISGWYNKNPPTPSLDNRYSDWSQTWQSLHGWQYTHTHKNNWILAMENPWGDCSCPLLPGWVGI